MSTPNQPSQPPRQPGSPQPAQPSSNDVGVHRLPDPDVRGLSVAHREAMLTAVRRRNPALVRSDRDWSAQIVDGVLGNVAAYGLPQGPAAVAYIRNDVTARLGEREGLAVPGAGESVHTALEEMGQIITGPGYRATPELASRAHAMLGSVTSARIIEADARERAGLQLGPEQAQAPSQVRAPAPAPDVTDVRARLLGSGALDPAAAAPAAGPAKTAQPAPPGWERVSMPGSPQAPVYQAPAPRDGGPGLG